MLNDGSATVSPFGGTPPYISYWSDMNGIAVNPNALSAGDYIIRVTDSSLCEVVDTFTVNGPTSSPIISNSITNVSCFGYTDGSINLITTDSVTYLWSTTDTSSSINSLSSGTYTVSVTDTFGCVNNFTYNITQPNPITLDSSNITNVSCFGYNDGIVDISISGGTAPYSYNWNNGNLNEDNDSLSIGVYMLDILDSNNCMSTTFSFVVSSPPILQSNLSSTSVSCNGASDANIITSVNGGVLPYSYMWSNADTVVNLNNISGGVYYLSVSDSNNCILNDSIEVYEPNSLSPNLTTTANTITGISSGGTVPYSYEFWGPNGFVASSVNNFGTTFTINPLISGMYTFIVVDSNNCTDSISIFYGSNFSPTLNISLSNNWCDSLSNLTITVSQDSGEVDMSTALLQSNAGYFDISSMSVGDTIGTSTLMAAGGSINVSAFLIVASIISSSQVIIHPCSPVNGCLGAFTITNSPSGGIELLAQSVPDGNNYTQGNFSSLTFNNVFVNPCVPLIFSSTINSELGDVDIQTVTFLMTMSEELNLNSFTIYPNPNNGTFKVSFTSEIEEYYNVSVFNVLGEIVYEEILNNFIGDYSKVINLNRIRKSIYFVQIETLKGKMSKKLVIN